ncbi:MAG: ABC transporter ATP-binding protein [Lachnospiraceae bacterium]|nr:ABC transporter ATP-binding protein [Lachnospiraceae bacterium]
MEDKEYVVEKEDREFAVGREDRESAAEQGDREYAIEVENLKVRYKCLNKISIRESIFSLRKSQVDIIEAVRGVSFKVPKGEIMGIIGKNGSGKSTLLRTLAGIFAPDEGTIDLHGHSVSLLSIGVGFQKKLSGRENILLSGMLLGFTEAQIREKMDEIIEFSELGDFIDRPVKTYSSGMYSKLAFSITAILETEIMLLDEVLSVGDVKFKRKSFRKMRQLISNEDRTVVIVSHNNNTIKRLCSSVLWIHEGEVKMQGPTSEILPKYRRFMSGGKKKKARRKKRLARKRMLEQQRAMAEGQAGLAEVPGNVEETQAVLTEVPGNVEETQAVLTEVPGTMGEAQGNQTE